MKYLLLITSIFIFIGCARQPLNVYSPHPVNTVIVKEDGDAGLNLAYFGNGPKHVGENILRSNGIDLQTKAVISKGIYIETGSSFLREIASKHNDYDVLNNQYAESKSVSNYKNIELGIGKIITLGANSNLLANVGYGKTNYNNSYIIKENNTTQNLNLSFANNHIYWGLGYQYSDKLIKEQFGFKYNFTKFGKIVSDNSNLYKNEIADLININCNYRPFLQLYQNFGVSPFKDQPWLSMHFYLCYNFRDNLSSLVTARELSAGLSFMASPSKILKRKK